jgi:diguanylate cyclase (GGDEF)-like protein
MLQRSAFFAASLRLLFGVMALLMFPKVYPGLADLRGVLLFYIAMSVVAQALVYFNLGGRVRPVVLGIIDVTLLSFLLFALGPSAMALAAAYFMLALLNALVVTPGFGMFMAFAGSASFGVVMLAEATRWPVGGLEPDHWGTTEPFSPGLAFFSWVFVSVMLGGATMVVVSLARRVESNERRLHELSQHDPLTGLFNRRYLSAALERELARAQRGKPLSLLMLDLDGFKLINDTRGHAEGDRLLQRLADVLREATRSVDVPGRWGGDEFVVLLPDTTIDEASMVAARLAEQIRQAGEAFDAERPVTASVGLAQAEPTDTPHRILARADARAYDAKRAGGDRVSLTAAE